MLQKVRVISGLESFLEMIEIMTSCGHKISDKSFYPRFENGSITASASSQRKNIVNPLRKARW